VQEKETQLVLRLIDEVFNGGRLSVIDELVHPDYFDHEAPASRALGPEGLRASVELLHAAFAGYRLEPTDVIAADGKVVVRGWASGRHVGSIDEAEESSSPQFHVFRIADGRIIEHWASRDAFTDLQQRQPDRPHISLEGAQSCECFSQP
jgi:predicted SnoaL-like aldol condensation-catalyzing enzyme